MTALASGTGVFTVSFNGEEFAVGANEGAPFTMVFGDPLPENSIVFSYAGEGYGEIVKISQNCGLVISLR